MTIDLVTDFQQQTKIPCALMLENWKISPLTAYFIASEFLDLLNHKHDIFYSYNIPNICPSA